MPVIKTVLDDLGSVVVKELVAAFNGQEVKVTKGAFAVADTTTYSDVLLMTQEELVLTNVYVGVESALANIDTDIIIDWDTDLSFATPLGVILNVEGFDSVGLPAGVYSVANVTGNPTNLVQATFPLLLPANSAIRVRFINNEGTTENFFVMAAYHPAEDLLAFRPSTVPAGRVLKQANRA